MVVAGRVVPLRCSVEHLPGLRTVAWLRDGLLLASRPLSPHQGRLEDTLQLGLHTEAAETVVECRPNLVEAGFDNNDMAASVRFSVEEEEVEELEDEQDYEDKDEDNSEEDEDTNDEYKEASDEDGDDDDDSGIEEDSSEEDDDDNNADYDVSANNSETPDSFNQYDHAEASDHDRDVPPEDAVTEQYEEPEHSIAPNVATDAATELETSSALDEDSAAATHLGGETEEDYYEDQYENEDDYEDEGEEYDYEAATYDYYSGVNADMHVVHREAQKSSAADTREEITLTDEDSEDHKSATEAEAEDQKGAAEAEAEDDATNPITSGQTRPAQLESSQDNVAVVSEPKSLKNTRRSSAETAFRHSTTFFQTCVLILIMKTIT